MGRFLENNTLQKINIIQFSNKIIELYILEHWKYRVKYKI